MRGRWLSEYIIPQPQAVDNDGFAREYRWEINYDQGEQQAYMWNVMLLCLQQTSVMCTTVKTFLINLVLAKIWSESM